MRALMISLGILALAGPALAQPSPPPAAAQVLQKGLFGEREPGDDETAEGAAQSPEAPPASVQAAPSSQAYDARVRQSYAAAESFQGRLDGGWIASSRGRDLLQLQLVDKGKGQVEGAWRDLLGGASPSSSGLIEPTPVSGGAFETSFTRGDGLRFRLTARLTAEGRLTGQLWRGDELFDLSFRRAP